jgi:hypothetical protein
MSLVGALEKRRIRCWISAGDHRETSVRSAIRVAAGLVVVVSRIEPFVEVERDIRLALSLGKPIFPLSVGPRPPAQRRINSLAQTVHDFLSLAEYQGSGEQLAILQIAGLERAPYELRTLRTEGDGVEHALRLFRELERLAEEESPPSQSISLAAYLDTRDMNLAHGVFSAMDDLAVTLGYSRPSSDETGYGSIWRRAQAAIAAGLSRNEIKERLQKVERAVELVHLDARQANVDVQETQAVANLVQSLKDVPQACVRVGSILFIKYLNEKGEPVVVARALTLRELRALERFPEIQRNPAGVLDGLALAITSETDAHDGITT